MFDTESAERTEGELRPHKNSLTGAELNTVMASAPPSHGWH